jgi:hypothetical protein
MSTFEEMMMRGPEMDWPTLKTRLERAGKTPEEIQEYYLTFTFYDAFKDERKRIREAPKKKKRSWWSWMTRNTTTVKC